MESGSHKCIKCGEKVGMKWPARQCQKCNEKSHALYRMTYGSRKARCAVSNALRSGLLRPASEFKCADCGVAATEYDHRDYNEPLYVVPVCHSCNVMRGKAIPLKKAA